MVEKPSKIQGRGTGVALVTREVAAVFGFSLAALFWVVGDATDDAPAAPGVVAEWRPNSVSIDSIQFRPDGDSLVISGRDGRVGFWGRTNGRPVREPLALPMGETLSALSHDGKILAVASQTGGLRLVSLDDDRAEADEGIRLPEITNRVHTLAFSPDDRLLAFGTTDGSLILWDHRAGRMLSRSKVHDDCIHSVAFSPDGRTLATGGMDRRVLVRDLRTGEAAELPLTRPHAILRVVFSPDGRTLAAAGRDSDYLSIWDVPTRRLVAEPRGLDFCTSALAFSSDGRHLFVGGSQRDVLVLSTQSWERERTLPGLPAWIKSLALSPDGRHLAVGTADGHVRVWDLEERMRNG